MPQIAGGDLEAGALDDRVGLISTVQINHIAGVINQEDIARLKKLIFGQTKGKSFIHIKVL